MDVRETRVAETAAVARVVFELLRALNFHEFHDMRH
jgi:hypothetical protein